MQKDKIGISRTLSQPPSYLSSSNHATSEYEDIANIDLISSELHSKHSTPQNRSPAKSFGSDASSASLTQPELAKDKLKDKSNKRKSVLNTYSSEELLLQAASSLQGLEGKRPELSSPDILN